MSDNRADPFCVSDSQKFVGRVKRFDSIKYVITKKSELGPMTFKPRPVLDSLSEETDMKAPRSPTALLADFVDRGQFTGVPDTSFLDRMKQFESSSAFLAETEEEDEEQ